jgi:rod shape-determining protein MreD
LQAIAKNVRVTGLRPPACVAAVFAAGACDLLLDGPHGRHFLWGFAPDVAVMMLVWLALRAESWASVVAAFFLGFLRDGISAGPAGGWALVLIVVALLIRALLVAVEVNRAWSAAALTFVAAAMSSIFLYPLLMYIYTGMNAVRVIYQYFSIYCLQALTTALIGIPVFRLLDRAAAERRE